MTYKTKKLIKLADDLKRDRKLSDTRSPLEKLIAGDISSAERDRLEDECENRANLIENQEQKYGE